MGHLLLIDTDRDFSTLCAALLDHAGHTVVTLHRLTDLAGQSPDRRFDLILLDPGEDFEAAINAARAWDRQVPILLLSGAIVTNAGLHGGSQSPFDRCRQLAKPFRVVELLAAVEESLGNPAPP